MLLPLIGQPPHAKRIYMLIQEGIEVEVFSFERTSRKGRNPNCKVTMLGRVEDEKYLSRIPILLAGIVKIRKKIKEADAVYAMSIDLSILAKVSAIGLNKKIQILELGDIRLLQTAPGMKGKLFRWFDEWFTRKLDLLVVTSAEYYTQYYQKWIGIDTDYIVIENKLENSGIKDDRHASVSQKKKTESPITIGYFGLMESKWSWEVLQKLAIMYPEKFNVLLAGVPNFLDDYESICLAHSNINYFGQYSSPDQLPELYSKIDVSWACSNPSLGNDWTLRWARTNRSYEACLFQKPIITRAGSSEGIFVESNGLGVTLDEVETDKAVDFLASVDWSQIEQWKLSLRSLDRSAYIYTDEASKLAKFIRAKVNIAV